MSPENEMPAAGSNAPLSVPANDSPGALIRQGRESKHVSLDDLAGLTKLSYNTLDALERNDFSALLEPVYVRGYYRKCAKVLDLPEKALLDAYQACVAPKSPAPPAKLRLASGGDLGSGTRLPVALAITAAVVAIALCAVLWIARSSRATPETQPVTVPTVDSSAAPVSGDSGSVPALDLSTPPAADAPAAAPQPQPQPQLQPEPQSQSQPLLPATPAEPVSAAPAEPGEPLAGDLAAPATAALEPEPAPQTPANALLLDFSAKSWVRIADAEGKVLFDGVGRPGESKLLQGQPPFSIFLGNSPAVRVEYQGAAIDVSKYQRSNKTARFVVPAGG
jgi:cytoskeleton protein RodZ